MSDRKITDDEVIKALECCIKAEVWGDCEELHCPATTPHGCYFYLRTDEDNENTIYIEMFKDALALINRQKAEIEEQDQAIIKALKHMGEIRAEAIKEFAERFKEGLLIHEGDFAIIEIADIDNLVKEMTEGGE